MIITLAKKEFQSALRDKILLVSTAIIWLLILTATFTGMLKHKETSAQKERAGNMFRHEWEEQEANPHSAAHFGTYLFKPNTFLSVYDNGLNNYLGISYRVEAHVQHELNQSAAEETDSQLRFGELSVALVFQLLMPLLIILISFNSITREREGNTLRMLLIQGAKPSSILWGKILGNYVIVLVIILPAMVIMSLPVFFEKSGADMIFRYALFSLSYLLYFFIFTGLTIIFSAWHTSSNASLLTCISIWVLLLILVPRMTIRVIDSADRLPSRFELSRNISQGYSKGMGDDGSSIKRYEKYLAETLKKYKVDSVTQLPVNFDGLSMQYGEDYNAKVYETYAGKVEDIIRRQQLKLEQFSLLNPFMAIQQVSMGVTGTDYFHHLAFHHQAKVYRDEFVRTLNLDLANSGSKHLSYAYKAGPDFFKKMKDFNYTPPAVTHSLGWHSWAWASLGIWCLLILPGVRISAKRLN